MTMSFVLLASSLKSLSPRIAYAISTDIGTVEIAILGVLRFGYLIDWIRLGCISLNVIGIVGLKLASAPAECSGSPFRLAIHRADWTA
jgi:quaternary ammonium compound-resistance protein SugE